MTFKLRSDAFKQGEIIPILHSCDGDDISPHLAWDGVPADTKSFVLIMDDPDAPMGTWDHWIMYNIPGDCKGFPQNLKYLRDEIKLGRNSWGNMAYGGPCPPDREHRYFFKLFALDCVLPLAGGAEKATVLKAMEGHILGEAELMGRYNRPGNPR